jgi:ribonuclease P protein component
MLSKKFRLTREQINLIYKKGRGKNFGTLGVKYLVSNNQFSRFAVVIPAKVVKLAVDRNRLRRITYDEIAKILPGKTASCDYIVRFYQKPADEKVLREVLQKVFKDV